MNTYPRDLSALLEAFDGHSQVERIIRIRFTPAIEISKLNTDF